MAINGDLVDIIDFPLIKDHDSFVDLLEKLASYVSALASSEVLSSAKDLKLHTRLDSVHVLI